MNLLNNVRSFLLEEEFQVHIYSGKVDIINYTNIGHFDSTKVIVYHAQGNIEIKGEKLVVSKLLNDEILVMGVIKNIEFR